MFLLTVIERFNARFFVYLSMGKYKKEHGRSRLGGFIKDNAPKLLDAVEDILPQNGAFGLVKNLISNSDELSAQEKESAIGLAELDLRRFEAESKDRDGARTREVELAKNKGVDWMMYAVGVVGLLSFIVCVYAVIWIPEVSNNELFIHLMGMVEGVVITSLFSYYFGGSIKEK